jgi:adenylylsulfate kinase
MTDNIYPVFDQILNRQEKEKTLNQKSIVIWISGLSGSGKTTIAQSVEMELSKLGFLTQIMDGDNIRTGLNNNLGFSKTDRLENIRRIAEVSKLFVNCGIICINAFITPTKEMRDIAFDIIGRSNIIDVFINSPLHICEKRDTKGLYKKARKGILKDFTGISSPFEKPENPDIELRTDLLSITESTQKCLKIILPKISFKE